LSLERTRSLVTRARRHLALALVLLTLCGALAVHHGLPSGIHEMDAAVMCLAVLGAAVAISTALAVRAPLPRPTLGSPGGGVLVAVVPGPIWARAGPLHLRLAVLRL